MRAWPSLKSDAGEPDRGRAIATDGEPAVGWLAKIASSPSAQMSPSMAKLPSQEDTALAFAEVYTAIEFLHGKLGWPGLRRILRELSVGKSDEQAIAVAYGGSFAQFERSWKGWLQVVASCAARPACTDAAALQKAGVASPRAGRKGAAGTSCGKTMTRARFATHGRAASLLGGPAAGPRALSGRSGRVRKAQAILGGTHPLVALKLGRTYLTLEDPDRAIAALEPARELYAELPGSTPRWAAPG